MFNINAGMKKSLGNTVVKDIKGTPLFRPRLLKLKINNGNLLRIKKLILTKLPLLIRIYRL